MKKRKIYLPTTKAREYLKEIGFYNDITEEKTKKVFLKKLKEYLLGQISSRFFSALANEILYGCFLDKGKSIENLALSNALEDASELEYQKSRVLGLTNVEDGLRSFFKNTKSLMGK